MHSVYLQRSEFCWIATPLIDYCMMVLQQKYCHEIIICIYRWFPLIDSKDFFISKVCLEITDPIKVHVMNKISFN